MQRITDVYTSRLHQLLQSGDSENVKIILQLGADVNGQNEDGNTPLTVAVQNDNLNCVLELISAGANVNATNRNGGHSP